MTSKVCRSKSLIETSQTKTEPQIKTEPQVKTEHQIKTEHISNPKVGQKRRFSPETIKLAEIEGKLF